MKVTLRLFLIITIGPWLYTACQPVATTPPEEPGKANRSTAGPTAVTEPTAYPILDPDIEEYAVYAALLENNFTRGESEQVLIVDQTRVNSAKLMEMDLTNFQENTPLAPELVESFKGRNQQPYPLEPNLDISIAYQLISQQEINELQPKDEASGGKLFYELYPKTTGFIYLSRVGFNDELNQALVYYEWYHFEQPILGGYYLMNRQDGRWEIENGYEWMT